MGEKEVDKILCKFHQEVMDISLELEKISDKITVLDNKMFSKIVELRGD